jgi:hypothetical protein
MSDVMTAMRLGGVALAVAFLAAASSEAQVVRRRDCGMLVPPPSDVSTVNEGTLGVRFDSVRGVPPEGQFNVGDIAHFKVRLSAGFGARPVMEGDRLVPGNFRVYVDGEEICHLPVHWHSSPPHADEFWVGIEARNLGRAEITFHADVSGHLSVLPGAEVGTARTESVVDLQVLEPYEVRLEPSEEEVEHGTDVRVTYRVVSRTRATGWLEGALFDGRDLSDYWPGSQGRIHGPVSVEGTFDTTMARDKSHPGCAYIPPHPGHVVLTWQPNHFAAVIRFDDGTSYRQSQPLPAVEAFDYGLIPECSAGQRYDPAACACVPLEPEPKEEVSQGGSGTTKYVVGGVLGAGAVIGLLAAGGGGESAEPPPPPAVSVAGSYGCGFVVTSNPGNHPNRLPGTFVLGVSLQGTTASITSSEPNFIGVRGPIVDNQVAATGAGVYAGFSTEARLTGRFEPAAGRITGQYDAGTNGSLPGGLPIGWSFQCQRQ